MSHWSPGGRVVTGIECEGPVYSPGGTSFSYRESVYPAHRDDHASLGSFADLHFAVEMVEGVVNSQAETMAVFGLLQAVTDASSRSCAANAARPAG